MRIVVSAIIIMSIAGMAGILYFVYAPDSSYNPDLNFALQLNARLNIAVGNQTARVPAGIGVQSSLWNYHGLDQYGKNGRAPMFTIDNYGLVIVASSVVRNYTLGEFFQIWGKTFDGRCVQVGSNLYCNTDGILTMSVNGKPNFQYDKYVLQNQDDVLIDFVPAHPA
jgi:hypothetical protein